MSEYDSPIIVNLPYGRYSLMDFDEAIRRTVDATGAIPHKSTLESHALHYVIGYPTVYIVYSTNQNRHNQHPTFTVYVGETNDIIQRTQQHLNADPKTRSDWLEVATATKTDEAAFHQYVIAHSRFNKSLTLDVENRLMHYMSSASSVTHLRNRRTNAQGDYFTSDQFDRIFTDIWLGLHRSDPELFPTEEIIHDSALFKASPFHKLNDEQKSAENGILDILSRRLNDSAAMNDAMNDRQRPTLIVISGAAGTGKTVLLSHLFYRINTELLVPEPAFASAADPEDDDDEIRMVSPAENRHKAYIVVNHKEQVTVYNQIATKLGLQKHEKAVVLKPTTFINRFSRQRAGGHGRGDVSTPEGKADIVLVDEAHLLKTQGDQGYSGKNQLWDILRRARIVVAVFDRDQILQSSQQWSQKDLDTIFTDQKDSVSSATGMPSHASTAFRHVSFGHDDGLPPLDMDVAHISFRHQFRIDASPSVIRWIEDFAHCRSIDAIELDDQGRDIHADSDQRPYEIRSFDSPHALVHAIRRKSMLASDGPDGQGLSRVLATYDWKYSSATANPDDPQGLWNVTLYKDGTGSWRATAPPDMEDKDVSQGHRRTSCVDHFAMPWNYQLKDPAPARGVNRHAAWAEKSYTIDEIGSTFTIQGFDLNYAGVIIGPSVQYRDGRIVINPHNSRNYLATNKRGGSQDFSVTNLRNELNVLLTRGVHGLYIFAVDRQLRDRLREILQPHLLG
ncbi:DUF2075 domain-containing protein [uncultured Bifidobacterium sp.]|uniref:DUF2075 domain-containing protein n=1 Tax=uncultured Bifidobacterium sp. TaxID=165187 RepID=UPI00262FD6D6|nr:DUF2075 domain-containing protein [uncultured Bifidobacterium sp.]